MRVLLTCHAFLPRSVAGVEVYTARLAGALQDLGHTVLVLTAVHNLAAPPHSIRRVKVGSLDVVEIVNNRLEGSLESTYSTPGVDGAIAKIVDNFQPDCVHAQHLLNLSTGLFQSARRAGAPVVLTLHDYWLSCPRDGLRMQANGRLCTTVDHDVCAACLGESPYVAPRGQRRALRVAQAAGLGGALHLLHRHAPRVTTALARLARSAEPTRPAELRSALDERATHLRQSVQDVDLFLAPTRFAAERALEWGVSADRLEVLSLGAILGPTRPRPAGARRRLGYVGTLAPHKGIHVLIEAVKQLHAADWTLDVVGNPRIDPAYTADLKQLARGDSRIHFRGPSRPEDNDRLWRSLDLLVLPSLWWENSPLTVLEALAAGVPVVASRTGGVPEVLPEEAGALVAPGDVPALRAAIEDVLDGRLLAGALDALPLKTASDGAAELIALYTRCRSR
jgi:glycosyltransferase involved in cell wall biosynthesis